MKLICALCASLSPSSSFDDDEDALAWSIVNGHATCEAHFHIARDSRSWDGALVAAQESERARIERKADEAWRTRAGWR